MEGLWSSHPHDAPDTDAAYRGVHVDAMEGCRNMPALVGNRQAYLRFYEHRHSLFFCKFQISDSRDLGNRATTHAATSVTHDFCSEKACNSISARQCKLHH